MKSLVFYFCTLLDLTILKLYNGKVFSSLLGETVGFSSVHNNLLYKYYIEILMSPSSQFFADSSAVREDITNKQSSTKMEDIFYIHDQVTVD